MTSKSYIPRKTGYVVPLENVTVRLSIRSLNKAIEHHSLERAKSKLTYNQLKYLIDKIPVNERPRYGRHCLPFAVMHSNPVALRMMIRKGLNPHKTWALFQALWKGDLAMSRDIAESQSFVLEESDRIVYQVAAYKGNVKLSQVFYQEVSDIEFREVIDKNKMSELISTQAKYVKRQLMMFYESDNRINKINKRCDCPSGNLEEIKRDVTALLNMTNEYSVSELDRLVQVCRAYGILKWGWLEYGGHGNVDLFVTEN